MHALVVLLSSRRRRRVEAKARTQGASLGSLPRSPGWEEAEEAADSRGPSAGLISSKLRHNDGSIDETTALNGGEPCVDSRRGGAYRTPSLRRPGSGGRNSGGPLADTISRLVPLINS